MGTRARCALAGALSLMLLPTVPAGSRGGGTMQSQDTAPGAATLAAVERFNDALNRHDAGAVADLLTPDTVFENTSPAPDGTRLDGRDAVAAFWRDWLARNPDARFEVEETIVAGDRCTVRWVYRKTRDGRPWHLRGVDLFTVRDGRIAAKRSYVKG
jgi:ketosteroid isomerase-like protein